MEAQEEKTRLFGCMCSGCNQIISPTELVMKALQYVYHIDCFKCHECGDKLEKGDEFLLKDDKLYCSSDFNVAEQRSDTDIFSSDESETMSMTSPKDLDDKNSSCKRPRTILTSQQREDFKAAFQITPKPCRKVREQLSNETGLSVRVVQVWFQNQRAKLKKLQRKAEEGSNSDKIKKINSNGKVRKKKTLKTNTPLKNIDEIPGENDLNNLANEQVANDSNSFSSLHGMNENFGANSLTNISNMPYYVQLSPGLINGTRNLTSVPNFPARLPPPTQYGRMPTLIDSNMSAVPQLQTNQNTFQIPALSTVASPSVSSNFQLMPHLMNSYI